MKHKVALLLTILVPAMVAGQEISKESPLIKITIDPSRTTITLGTRSGVSAEIKNVSNTAVRLYETETVFVTQPETRLYGETGGQIQGCATFPTQGTSQQGSRPARGWDLVIQPGDTYRVFWDMDRNGCAVQPSTGGGAGMAKWIEDKWQRMMFAPGFYKVFLNVRYYLAAGTDANSYRTITDSRDISVAASEQMILVGAFLGGLLAWVLKVYFNVDTGLTKAMSGSRWRPLLKWTEPFAAGLFSFVLVILASRLSESFPIKINANDFWGAIALGFVFQWMGVKLLESLPGMPKTS
jgi:hypothetical protein